MSKSQDVSIAETDIAVVGMAGRFPGARTIQTFWEQSVQRRRVCDVIQR